jgi:AraC-like DNA-binding protein
MLLSGFRHYSNFCRQFRAFFGENPSACRPSTRSVRRERERERERVVEVLGRRTARR